MELVLLHSMTDVACQMHFRFRQSGLSFLLDWCHQFFPAAQQHFLGNGPVVLVGIVSFWHFIFIFLFTKAIFGSKMNSGPKSLTKWVQARNTGIPLGHQIPIQDPADCTFGTPASSQGEIQNIFLSFLLVTLISFEVTGSM